MGVIPAGPIVVPFVGSSEAKLTSFIDYKITTTAASETHALPISTAAAVDIEVDWGDGSEFESFTTNTAVHTFTTPGTYTVRIGGNSLDRFSFNGGGDRLQVASIDKLETDFLGLTNAAGMWRGCSNAIGPLPNFASCTLWTSGFLTFRDCSGLTGSFPDLSPLSSVVNANQLFRGCSGITGSPASIDGMTSLAIASSMFQQCAGLTGTIPPFGSLPSLVNTSNMYLLCNGLTGGTPDLSLLTGLTNTTSMFNNCASLNGTIGAIGNQTTLSKANGMFANCGQLTGAAPSLSALTGLTDISAMFQSCVNLTSLPVGVMDSTTHAGLVDFENTFQNCTGVTVTLPEFWNDFPAATLTASCFAGCVNAPNFGAVPAAWL